MESLIVVYDWFYIPHMAKNVSAAFFKSFVQCQDVSKEESLQRNVIWLITIEERYWMELWKMEF